MNQNLSIRRIFHRRTEPCEAGHGRYAATTSAVIRRTVKQWKILPVDNLLHISDFTAVCFRTKLQDLSAGRQQINEQLRSALWITWPRFKGGILPVQSTAPHLSGKKTRSTQRAIPSGVILTRITMYTPTLYVSQPFCDSHILWQVSMIYLSNEVGDEYRNSNEIFQVPISWAGLYQF
jgi:hypothetical protein